jgi:hypothetical protein
MLTRRLHDAGLHDAGLRDWQMQSLCCGSVGLCVALWIRAKTVDQLERVAARASGPRRARWPGTCR